MWDFLWGLIKDSVSVIKVVGSIIAVVVGIMFGRQQRKEWLARKNKGIDPNPERCEKQIGRIDSLEKACAQYATDIGNLQRTTDRIDRNVEKLIDFHMKP